MLLWSFLNKVGLLDRALRGAAPSFIEEVFHAGAVIQACLQLVPREQQHLAPILYWDERFAHLARGFYLLRRVEVSSVTRRGQGAIDREMRPSVSINVELGL